MIQWFFVEGAKTVAQYESGGFLRVECSASFGCQTNTYVKIMEAPVDFCLLGFFGFYIPGIMGELSICWTKVL